MGASDEVTPVPEEQRVAAEDGDVGAAQSDALGEAGAVADPLRHGQRRRVGPHHPLLAHERLHDAYLRQRLLRDAAGVGQRVLAPGGELGERGGAEAADDGDERDDGEGDEGELPGGGESDDEAGDEGGEVVDEVAELLADGVLDDDSVGVDGVDDVGGADGGGEEGDVLVEGGVEVADAHPGGLPLAGPHPAGDLGPGGGPDGGADDEEVEGVLADAAEQCVRGCGVGAEGVDEGGEEAEEDREGAAVDEGAQRAQGHEDVVEAVGEAEELTERGRREGLGRWKVGGLDVGRRRRRLRRRRSKGSRWRWRCCCWCIRLRMGLWRMVVVEEVRVRGLVGGGEMEGLELRVGGGIGAEDDDAALYLLLHA